jgi:osmotically-inducible protein OsmY
LSALTGTVTLRGTVASADDKSAIEKLVRAVPGVREVNDELQVKTE